MHEEHNETQKNDNDVSDEVLLDIDEEIEVSPKDPLAEELDQERKKASDFFDRLQRLQAEFENYRKRMDGLILDARKFAGEEILLKFLEIYDNILRALDVDFQKDPVAARNGIEAIEKQFEKILLTEDVRPIESLGKEFDPYYHHALNSKSDTGKPDGTILDEYQRGYMYKEKVLRPSIVCVNRHAPQPAEETENSETTTEQDENGE
jgi:molecular chaperone GrpE